MIEKKIIALNKLQDLKKQNIVLATHNKGKISEITTLLNKNHLKTISAKTLDLSEPIEDGSSFEENAFIKASNASKSTGLPSLSDDSGLCINALNGDPGVYSADWAGKNKDFKVAIHKVEKMMRLSSTNDKSAKMYCALCLCWPDGDYIIKNGEINGNIVFPPRGTKGFGYDPIFVPDIQPKKGFSLTFGEIDPIFKNNNCHRSIAFKKLMISILNE